MRELGAGQKSTSSRDAVSLRERAELAFIGELYARGVGFLLSSARRAVAPLPRLTKFALRWRHLQFDPFAAHQIGLFGRLLMNRA